MGIVYTAVYHILTSYYFNDAFILSQDYSVSIFSTFTSEVSPTMRAHYYLRSSGGGVSLFLRTACVHGLGGHKTAYAYLAYARSPEFRTGNYLQQPACLRYIANLPAFCGRVDHFVAYDIQEGDQERCVCRAYRWERV